MTTQQHTPTPYTLRRSREGRLDAWHIDAPGIQNGIARVYGEATARFMVGAANTHDDLVKALEKIRAEESCSPVIAFIADEAIKLAKASAQ